MFRWIRFLTIPTLRAALNLGPTGSRFVAWQSCLIEILRHPRRRRSAQTAPPVGKEGPVHGSSGIAEDTTTQAASTIDTWPEPVKSDEGNETIDYAVANHTT